MLLQHSLFAHMSHLVSSQGVCNTALASKMALWFWNSPALSQDKRLAPKSHYTAVLLNLTPYCIWQRTVRVVNLVRVLDVTAYYIGVLVHWWNPNLTQNFGSMFLGAECQEYKKWAEWFSMEKMEAEDRKGQQSLQECASKNPRHTLFSWHLLLANTQLVCNWHSCKPPNISWELKDAFS